MLGLDRRATSRCRPRGEVLAPAVARRLRQAMEAVAAFGTGAALAPPGFPVAMKTGTAAEPGHGYHVNYIGFGPLPDPHGRLLRPRDERARPRPRSPAPRAR